jgi:hypothetical protein
LAAVGVRPRGRMRQLHGWGGWRWWQRLSRRRLRLKLRLRPRLRGGQRRRQRRRRRWRGHGKTRRGGAG